MAVIGTPWHGTGEERVDQPHPLAGIPARLWQAVAVASHRLLMLDYDGTLAPFSTDRGQALPPARTRALLERLAAARGTTLAVVSGRPMEQLEGLVGALPVTLVGEHGWDLRDPRGGHIEHPLPADQAALLDRAEADARAGGLGARLERKRASIVLHTRGVPPDEARAAVEAATRLWRPILSARTAGGPGGARLDAIARGLELRLRGHDKGTAVSDLLARSSAGPLAVYVGDEITDEDAFRAVRERGFGVKVREPEGPTLATGRLADPDAVTAFLEEWVRVTGA